MELNIPISISPHKEYLDELMSNIQTDYDIDHILVWSREEDDFIYVYTIMQRVQDDMVNFNKLLSDFNDQDLSVIDFNDEAFEHRVVYKKLYTSNYRPLLRFKLHKHTKEILNLTISFDRDFMNFEYDLDEYKRVFNLPTPKADKIIGVEFNEIAYFYDDVVDIINGSPNLKLAENDILDRYGKLPFCCTLSFDLSTIKMYVLDKDLNDLLCTYKDTYINGVLTKQALYYKYEVDLDEN